MKKFALRLILLLVLCSSLVSIPEIRIAKAESTIYIREDGWVTGTDKIHRDGNVYTLTDNIFNQTISVQKDRVRIDGAGYTLQGPGSSIAEDIFAPTGRGTGIYLPASNVIIRNVEIRNFTFGIYIRRGANNEITGNTITNNIEGIRDNGSSQNIIFGNTITNNTCGVHLAGIVSYITIYHNWFINNTRDLSIWPYCWTYHLYRGSVGNYWDTYNGTDNDGDGIGDTPHGRDKYPLVPDWIPPDISIISPENRTYDASNVSLTFTINESTSWIRYSLDGQRNVTITGNTTLIDLSDGKHNLTLYAEDSVPAYQTSGNIGASTIHFTIAQKTESTEPFTTWIVAVIVIITIGGVALLVYFGRRRKTAEVKGVPEGVM